MHARFLVQHDELRRRREEYDASKKGPGEECALVVQRRREKKTRRRAAEEHAAALAKTCELEAAMRVKADAKALAKAELEAAIRANANAKAKAKADAEALATAKVRAAIRAVHKQAAQAAEIEAARVALEKKNRAVERAAQVERQRRAVRQERLVRAAARERQAAHERAQQDEIDYDELEEALRASVEQLRIEAMRDEEIAAVANTDTESAKHVFRECIICMAKPPSHVLVPCGHLCMCMACSVALEQCPICRVHVQSTMRVYFSA